MSLAKRRSGFSQIELLIVSSLTLTFLGILVYLLFRVSGMVHRTAVVSELQQTAHLLFTQISQVAHRCDDGGATFLQEPGLAALALHPVEDVDLSARKEYAPQVMLFAWEATAQTLRQHRSNAIPPDQRYRPLKLGPEAIRNLALTPAVKVMSKHLAEFHLESPDGNFPLLLSFKLSRNAPGSGVIEIALSRYLVMRNSY